MLKQIVLAAGVGTALLGAVGPACAHARLKSSQPAAGSTGAAPEAITLGFSEGVVPKFSGIALSDASGKPQQIGSAVKGADAASLTASITAKLSPGTYTVTWHAVAVDSHRTQGSFRFTVTR